MAVKLSNRGGVITLTRSASHADSIRRFVYEIYKRDLNVSNSKGDFSVQPELLLQRTFRYVEEYRCQVETR